jgi:hypothetical protein
VVVSVDPVEGGDGVCDSSSMNSSNASISSVVQSSLGTEVVVCEVGSEDGSDFSLLADIVIASLLR